MKHVLPVFFGLYAPASPAANSEEAGLGDTWFKVRLSQSIQVTAEALRI